MDKEYIKEHNVVERFVLNQLTEAERDDFIVYQMLHPEIRKEVQVMRTIGKNFRAQKNAATIASLTNTNNHKKWLWLVLVVFIGGLIFYLSDPFSSVSENCIEAPNETIAPATPGDASKITQPSITEPQPTPPPKSTSIHKTPAKTKTVPPKTAKPKRAIAAADLAPNPLLEASIGLQYRGDDYNFSMLSPQKDEKMAMKKGMVELTFSGNTESGEDAILDEFDLLVFSNKEEDYKAFKPLFSKSLSFEKNKEGSFNFEIKASLELKPGLYYFMIEDLNSGKPYVVERFFVGLVD